MLKLPEGVRIWVAKEPCDMRKQADGLSALVQGSLGQQPKSGHLFVFFFLQRNGCDPWCRSLSARFKIWVRSKNESFDTIHGLSGAHAFT